MQRTLSLLIIFVLFGLVLFLLEPIDRLVNKQGILTDIKCNKIDYKNQNKLKRSSLEKFAIELYIDNERQWKKNIILDKIRSLQNKWNFFAYEKNKKRFKARLYLYLNNELTCYYTAKVRAHGDLNDHRRGSALPSLNIHLTEGNLFGITKFVLFRPSTRNYESEIFGANLLRELELLSPRTMMVDVIYNKIKSKFIFQEKIVKEFAEELRYVENPIFEADERFVFIELTNGNDFFQREARKLQKSRLVNHKIVVDDKSHLNNSMYAMSILNELSHKYESNLLPYWIMDYYSINNLLDQNNNHFENIPIFDSLLYALKGTHALAADDRRFYFDHINQNFLPIYYDGDFEIFNKNNFLDTKFNNNIINKISPSAVKGAGEALSRLEELDIKQFYSSLVKYGSQLNLDEITKAIEIIKIRLNNIKKSNTENIAKVFIKDDLKVPNDIKFVSKLKRKITFNTKLDNNFFICDIYANNCEKLVLEPNQISKLLSQELKIDDYEIVYIGKEYTDSLNTGWKRDNIREFRKLKEKTIDVDIKFKYYGDIEFEIIEQTKKIIFKKKDQDGRVIFNKSNIVDWDIVFLDISENLNNENSLKNFSGLTGCLTFVDSKLDISKIYVNNSKCEDALNIIRSEGKINEIKISNSISDGLDIDFSKIFIKNLYSKNSKNDCADFSYGNYKINKVVLENCGDKGISIGEGSNINSNLININQSNIGIAAKDSSEFFSNNVKINNSKICLSAYNKKQEFGGGYMNIENFKCENYQEAIKVDTVSKIQINENI